MMATGTRTLTGAMLATGTWMATMKAAGARVAPFLLTRAPLDTLVSLDTSLARMVTPKTAARQATVRTDPTTTAIFMVLTEPSTLASWPLRLDIVDLLSASIAMIVGGWVVVGGWW